MVSATFAGFIGHLLPPVKSGTPSLAQWSAEGRDVVIAIKIIDGASSSTKDAEGKMLQSVKSTNKLVVPAAMLEQWSVYQFQRKQMAAVDRPVADMFA